jgi:hypothetical protein
MIHSMKPITLRGITPELERVLRRRAAESGESLNRVVIELLEQAAGLIRRPPREPHHDLDRFSGTWTAEQADEFDRDLAEQRRVEADLWK